jgi:hypothetical protein
VVARFRGRKALYPNYLVFDVLAPKCRLHPLGTISSPVYLAEGASDAKLWCFSSGTPRGQVLLLAPISGLFEARTLPSRVARSSSGENAAPRRGAWPPKPPGAVPTCSLVVDSTHALAFCRGRCGRSLLGGPRLSTCLYRLPPRDTASSVAHDVIALGARNDAF